MNSVFKFFSILFLLSLNACKFGQKEEILFKKLSPEESKVTFANNVKKTQDFNILDYLYFYNGGGVSSGDINNDCLVDLFFVSNQGKNKLYLNKGVKNGQPEFEDNL